MSRAPVGLYVHVPFCLSICPYCDFVVHAGRAARGASQRIDAFVDGLVVEIGLRASPAASLGSVYLGGGTPSLMSVVQAERILSAIEQAFGIAPAAEVTIEVNPGPDERGDLDGFRALGINRLSIGAQSFQASELRRLGRRHTAADIAATVTAARHAGFDNISLDLLYDVPGQTTETWRRTLDTAVALQPEHVSAYALALDDPQSEGLSGPLGDRLPTRPGAQRWRERARLEQDEDRAAASYEIADDTLRAAGLDWYELSNWARPGRASRHNLAYWRDEAWEAVGPGAHAFDGARTRRWNAARLDAYLSALLPADGSDTRLPPGGFETTDVDAVVADRAILRLRTSAGLPAAALPQFGAALAWARANGLTEPSDTGGVRLTRRGRLLSNELFVRLLPDASSAAA
ncbi:MAG: radical SAM family heme chaperone HemW [Candidatus Limnocylindrales bacterium]